MESIGQICFHCEKGNIVVFKDIPNIIDTSLFDLLNKFYTRKADSSSIFKVITETGASKRMNVSNMFSCLTIITREKLVKVEAPYLSRFEKYKFSFEAFCDEFPIL